MKKYIWVMMLTLLIISLMSYVVLGQETETDSIRCDNGCPITALDGDSSNARVYLVTSDNEYKCNQEVWDIDLTTNASVAQWIDISFTGETWNWYVRKPGEYYTMCNKITLASNEQVTVKFKEINNLKSLTSDIAEEIETAYSIGDSGWINAANLNQKEKVYTDSLDLHDGIEITLGNKIKVVNCNSACEYTGSATIQFTLDKQKDWLDVDGNFLMHGTGTNQYDYYSTTPFEPVRS